MIYPYNTNSSYDNSLDDNDPVNDSYRKDE